MSPTKRNIINLPQNLDPVDEKAFIFFKSEKEAKSDLFNYRLYNMARRVHCGTGD